VFISYGRINNADILIDYGFAYLNNRYDSFLFRLYKRKRGLKGIVETLHIKTKSYADVLGNPSLSNASHLFIVKQGKLNDEVLQYYRRGIIRELKLNRKHRRFLTQVPSCAKLEVMVLTRTIDLYN